MVLLPNGEEILKTSLFISTEYTNVTDGHRHRLCIELRGKHDRNMLMLMLSLRERDHIYN